jgi:hypothetical protein
VTSSQADVPASYGLTLEVLRHKEKGEGSAVAAHAAKCGSTNLLRFAFQNDNCQEPDESLPIHKLYVCSALSRIGPSCGRNTPTAVSNCQPTIILRKQLTGDDVVFWVVTPCGLADGYQSFR